MEGKKTKGKQKREIKKIENEKDLYIAFTKRKSGIHKKATELNTLCGAKVDILMYSPTGKPFCYGEPSLQSMAMTTLNEENPLEGSIDKLVEEQRRLEIEDLNRKNDALSDQLHVEKAREKELGGILETRSSCDWWEADVEDLSYDQAKGMDASFVDLHKKLTNELLIKGGEIASHAFPPVDQTSGFNSNPTYAGGSNMSEVVFETNNKAYEIGASKNNQHDFAHIDETSGVNSNPTYACGSNISDVVFGANDKDYGIGASKNTPTHFSFVPTNEVHAFDLIPYDESRGDLFDNNFASIQAPRASLFDFDDPKGIGKSIVSSLPTSQTQGLHLTDASERGCHASPFSPINQNQGDNPLLFNACNENSGGSGGHAPPLPFPNKFKGDNLFPFRARNENSGGSGIHALSLSSTLHQYQGENPFLYKESNENAD